MDKTNYHKEYSEQLYLDIQKIKDKHKREIEKLKIKEIERSQNPQGESDHFAQQMAADSININDIINI